MSVALTTGATPVPFSVTGEPVTATLAAMVAVPGFAPGGATGEKTTGIVQVAPALRVAPQVPPDREYGPVNVTAMPVNVAVPVLFRVSVCEALVVPSTTLPKFSGPPVTLAIVWLEAPLGPFHLYDCRP